MSYKIEGSNAKLPECVQIFGVKDTPTGIVRIHQAIYKPIGNQGDDGPFDFQITGSGAQYIYLYGTRLHCNIKIQTLDGKDISAAENCGPVNNTMDSLFRQCDTTLQDKLVSSADMNYPYKGFFHNFLNYGQHAKEEQLSAMVLWSKDIAGKMDATSPVTGGNTGLTKRFVRLQKSIECDLEGPLRADIFQIRKPLLNGVMLKVKLWPSANAFRLMATSPNKYKIVFTLVELKMVLVTFSPALITSHAEILSDTNAHYDYYKHEIKALSLPAGQRTVNLEDMWLGDIADKLVVGLVSAKAYSGDYTKNPFNFQHFNLNLIDVQINGVSCKNCPLFPKIEYVMDGTKKINASNVLPSYLTLFDGINKYLKNVELDIDLDEYIDGNFVHVFDTTSTDPCGESENQLLRKGNMKLCIQFKEALPETVTLIIKGSFPAYFEIDEARNVFP